MVVGVDSGQLTARAATAHMQGMAPWPVSANSMKPYALVSNRPQPTTPMLVFLLSPPRRPGATARGCESRRTGSTAAATRGASCHVFQSPAAALDPQARSAGARVVHSRWPGSRPAAACPLPGLPLLTPPSLLQSTCCGQTWQAGQGRARWSREGDLQVTASLASWPPGSS